MPERLAGYGSGVRNAPTIGSPIRRRGRRFARKLRKLFCPPIGIADALDTPGGDVGRRLRMQLARLATPRRVDLDPNINIPNRA